MNRNPYSLENDKDLDDARNDAADVLRSEENKVRSDCVAITRGLLYLGDVLRKGFDLLADKLEK